MAYSGWKPSAVLIFAVAVAGCQSGSQQRSGLADATIGQPVGETSPIAAIGKTGDAVRDALRIEPRRVKALDPTDLEYDPGPIKPSLHVSAASVMESTGQLDQAHEHYIEALKQEPSNRTALIGIARLRHRQGQTEQAIAAYRHAADVLGNDPVILNDLALCLSRAQRYDEAVANLQAALSLNPNSLMYRNNLAAVLVQAGRADEAVPVLAASHGMAVAHYNVGYLLNQSGHPAAASAHFVQALQANPSFEPARQMLDRVLPEVGQGPDQRIAERPEPSSTSSYGPLDTEADRTRTAADVAAPPVQPEHPSDSNPASPSPAGVVPVDYAEPVTESVSLPAIPPIRLPEPRLHRPSLPGPGGFVAPSPAGP